MCLTLTFISYLKQTEPQNLKSVNRNWKKICVRVFYLRVGTCQACVPERGSP